MAWLLQLECCLLEQHPYAGTRDTIPCHHRGGRTRSTRRTGFVMWPTIDGVRVLKDQESSLVRAAIAVMVDHMAAERCDDDQPWRDEHAPVLVE